MKDPVRKVGLFYSSMPRKFVDFVLVWETPSSEGKKNKAEEDEAIEKRRIFERNLEEEGLHLEREILEGSNLNFVKIHSSMELLRRYAEILRLRLPMKESTLELDDDIPEVAAFKQEQNEEAKRRRQHSRLRKFYDRLSQKFSYNEHACPPTTTNRLTAIFSRDKEYLFDIDEMEFFTPGIRSSIIDFIIRRKRYSRNINDEFAFGIERLMAEKVYCSAYPLHDGDVRSPGTHRHLLYKEWASLRNCLKCQPLHHIKEYFGVNIGLYFAWLGYYTRMLIPASILGFFCFIYGVGTLSSDDYSKKICEDDNQHIMCPLCSEYCSYWRLDSTCQMSRFTYVFDNYATVIFAVLMSFWAAIFLEFWKRYSAQITHKWDLSSFDITEEQPRLEYLSRLKRLKKLDTDVVNINTEPHVSFWRIKVPFHLLSISAVLFLVTLAVAVLLGVISYRVVMLKILGKDPNYRSSGMLIVSSTAAGMNLIVIVIFNLIYTSVAQYLTEIELHRTQAEFDDSLTLKIFVLQFVNYYASIFYIAFFKGRFANSPDKKSNFLNEEMCAPAGCMTELCIQLAIIMVGKQFMGGVLEMTLPVVQKWVTHVKFLVTSKRQRTRRPAFSTQWSKDFRLVSWNSRSLFNEYLEMVVQYGFVTIFVAAFPLAPLFALINNVLEMRLDATKMLIYNRRPVSQRVKNIGVWYEILDTISKIAVVSNALIIAFTSNFIQKFMYYTLQDEPGIHFLNHSLTSFNISDFDNDTRTLPVDLDETVQNTGICWFQAYAHNHTFPPDKKYHKTRFFWKLTAYRLIFVLAFQNVVSICVLILKVIIPDVPKNLQTRIRQENHLTSEIIIKHEMLRARKESTMHSPPPPPPASEVLELELANAEESSPINNKVKNSNVPLANQQQAKVMKNDGKFQTIKVFGRRKKRNSSSSDEANDTKI